MSKQTPSQTVGPFFHFGLFFQGTNDLVNDQTRGKRIYIKGRVIDGDGNPVPDALVEIWQADAQGIYRHPADPRHAKADPHFVGFGRSDTVDDGQFWFKTIKPGCVPWDDQQDQAPHIDVRVFARGMLTHAITRLYFSDESANEADPVLNLIEDPLRWQTLIASLLESEDLPTYCFNIVLQGDLETVFFSP
jgi:protocatechuate 3,4-dioxygenase alpha subunit